MKIHVPSPESSQKNKRNRLIRFTGGIFGGIIFFGLAGLNLFSHGLDMVNTATWIALGFGVLSFGFLTMWFGSQFWNIIFRR